MDIKILIINVFLSLIFSDVRHEDGGIYGCEDPTNDVEMYKVVKVE